MTTYSTPHFANGLPDRNVRPATGTESNNFHARDASLRAPLASATRPPSACQRAGRRNGSRTATRAFPKAAIGVLGAALIGGLAVAARPAVAGQPCHAERHAGCRRRRRAAEFRCATAPVAKAAANGTDAVTRMDEEPAVGGNTAAADTAPTQSSAQPAAAPAPVAAPVAPATVAPTVARHLRAPGGAPIVAPAPVVTPPADTVAKPHVPDRSVIAPAPAMPQPEPAAPAMQQTPDATTLTPSMPAPAPTEPAPVTPDAGSSPGGNQ